MSYTEVLERKSEILKKTMENWILKENRDGLNRQEAHIYRNMLKELHQNEQELHTAREEERPEAKSAQDAPANREPVSQGV
ncbi:hypothetical protein CDO73_12895 [Saccharibacillus sp. O23]|uniref:hypothetical protein n=1 Tax=Saccharibacillus sp. O23 TaxID=2009338 RepID=UPI000B4E465E|nr:hypothetical protein [Saccharibacillus sp. O23]OWR29969.1 hypothetical protein CDO73_12895 [Saccharibacillus sp. O23]